MMSMTRRLYQPPLLSSNQPPSSSSATASTTTPLLCPCHSGASTLCSVCVRRGLQAKAERRQWALSEWNDARETCRQNLLQHQQTSSQQQEWSELAWEVQDMKQRLEALQQESSRRALAVAQRAVQLEDRQAELIQRHEHVTDLRLKLQKLTQSVLHDSLIRTIASSQNTAHRLRVQWAVTALTDFYRLQDEPPHMESSSTTVALPRQAKGIGKIGGLPLPHAGLELFGVLPPAELQSALRLVAILIQTVAECLAIPLPHPILITPQQNVAVNDIAAADALQQQQQQRQHQYQYQNQSNEAAAPAATATSTALGGVSGLASSTTSLVASWMGSAALSATITPSAMSSSRFQEATQSIANAASSSLSSSLSPSPQYPSAGYQQHQQQQPSLDAAQIQRRIHHARAAVLAEDDSPTASQYALIVEQVEAFGIAWQLLQNDVVALCIRAGVPVQELWPAEAVLLNLHALRNHLQAKL